MPLRVPAHTHEMSTLAAALAYADAGWYVLPLRPGKHAGSVVGRGWPDKSSHDRELVRAWFTDPPFELSIALHVGRSGAVVFDADRPNHLPLILLQLFNVDQPPFQRTRDDEPMRGHYVFTLPEGIELGNGLGKLGPGHGRERWGDVRGRNGIIVVAPSPRPPGRAYRWLVTGQPPPLPQQIARLLLGDPNPHSTWEHAPQVIAQDRLNALMKGLRGAQQGERNSMLFWTTCRVGEVVQRGEAERVGWETYLVELAKHLGLGEHEARATVASGFRTAQWVYGA